MSARDRRLEINPLTAQVFDGRLNARLESDLSGPSPAHALGLELAGFRVERFFETFQPGHAVEGSATFVAQLDFVNLRFRDMRVAVIDPEGCAVVEQRIRGGFHEPTIDEPNVLVTLTAPFVDLLERGVALLTESSCDPFYTGRIAHP